MSPAPRRSTPCAFPDFPRWARRSRASPPPSTPQPLYVITVRRTNPGDAFNNPAEDMNRLHAYLRGKPDFAAANLVALVRRGGRCSGCEPRERGSPSK
jgi:hypothetical protein